MKIGALAAIPLRGKTARGLVVEVNEASSARTEIRTATFQTQKIIASLADNFYDDHFLKTAEKTADYFATSMGAVLRILTPSIAFPPLITTSGKTTHQEKINIEKQRIFGPPIGKKYRPTLLVGSQHEVFDACKKIIRESLAKKESIIIICPTITLAEETKKILAKGIENHFVVLHAQILRSAAQKIITEKIMGDHPIVLCATAPYLFYRRRDLGTVIVIRESSRYYQSRIRPFIDTVYFIKQLAKLDGVKLILTDFLPRETTYHELITGALSPEKYLPLTAPPAGATKKIIDMKAYRFNASKQRFEILSDELKQIIEKVNQEKTRLFILVAKAGYANTIVCGDCGEILSCPKCQTPLRLQSAGGQRIFHCQHCSYTENANRLCGICQSWKLLPLGVGVDRVFEDIKTKYPLSVVFKYDPAEMSKREKSEVIKKFFETEGAIFIGTEAALNILTNPVEYSAIAAIDTLFALPDLNVNTRVAALINALQALTKKEMIIQTRKPDHPVIRYAAGESLREFYQTELDYREKLGYPPFKVLLKISLSGQAPRLLPEMKKALAALSPTTFEIYPAGKTSRGSATLCALTRLSPADWPEAKLLAKIRALPKKFKVEINPDQLV